MKTLRFKKKYPGQIKEPQGIVSETAERGIIVLCRSSAVRSSGAADRWSIQGGLAALGGSSFREYIVKSAYS
jgi:hypothetical protein